MFRMAWMTGMNELVTGVEGMTFKKNHGIRCLIIYMANGAANAELLR